LTVTADRAPERLRYVSLESFDGTYWTTRARYRRAGTRLPAGPGPGPGATGEVRTERVRVNHPDGLGWLVSSGRPTEVSVPDLGVDEAGGDVVVPADRPVPGDYRVRSVVTVPDETALLAADAADPAGPAAVAGPGDPVAPGAAPDDLADWGRQVTGGERGYRALRSLAGHFADYRLDTGDPPGGHGLFQIRRLRQVRSGTAEQYASAFAVLARSLGYDVRVVVGFRPTPAGPGRYQVTGAGVHAWAEVRFTRVGWVPFDPTPSRPATDEPEDPAAAVQPQPSRSVPPDDSVGTPTSAAPVPPPVAASGRPPGPTAALAAAALLAILLLGAGTVPTLKGVRRARRRAVGDPGRRAIGAWREVVDRLRDAGVALAPTLTVGEVVAAVDRRFGVAAVPLRRLAGLHDEAAFAPDGLAPAAADVAWEQADLARHSVRTRLSPVARLRAALNPRSLTDFGP
jgi:transglutaminase-like putative cysteine protease